MIALFRWLLVLLVAVALEAAAFAGNIKFCQKMLTDFPDAYPDIPVYDDYLHDNTVERPMRGVRWKVTDTTADPDIEHIAFSDDSGTDSGCVTFPLIAGHHHLVTNQTWALVGDDHEIKVKATVGGAVYTVVRDADYVAPWNDTSQTYTQNGGTQWGMLTTAAWALYHRDGGTYDEEWTLYNGLCPGEGNSLCFSCDPDQDDVASVDCYGGTDNEPAAIFAGSPRRGVVAHELGHYLLRKRNEGGGSSNNAGADPEGCFYTDIYGDSHEMQSKEWFAEAFHEGFADFYAAVTFNDESESDCVYHYYRDQNYDLDNDEDPSDQAVPNAAAAVNCDNIPEKLPDGSWPEPLDPLDSAVTAYDYLDDCVNGLGMGGDIANRATELDTLRFLMSMYQSSSWTLVDIVDVIDAANPHQWIGATDADDDVNTPPNLPAATIAQTLDSQFSEIEEAEWLSAATLHGFHR